MGALGTLVLAVTLGGLVWYGYAVAIRWLYYRLMWRLWPLIARFEAWSERVLLDVPEEHRRWS